MLHGFGGTVCVVICEVVDLASVDAAAVVDRLDIGHNSLAHETDR